MSDLHNFNAGRKSWKMYAKELTSISGDDIAITPYDEEDLILEVSGNGNISFKEDGITYNLADLSNIKLTNYDDASFNNVDISGTLNASNSNNTIKYSSHLIPTTNDTFDIGSAEYKVRDLYVADNSIFIGDKNKLGIDESGGLIIMERDTSVIPSGIYEGTGITDINDSAGVLVDISNKLQTSFESLSDVKLEDWQKYSDFLTNEANIQAKTLNEIYKPITKTDWKSKKTISNLLNEFSDASFGNVDISGGVINFFASDEQILGPDTGIVQKVQDLSNNLLTSNHDASFNNVDICGNLDICSNLNINEDLSVNGHIDANDASLNNVTVNGNLSVNGVVSFPNGVNITNDLSIQDSQFGIPEIQATNQFHIRSNPVGTATNDYIEFTGATLRACNNATNTIPLNITGDLDVNAGVLTGGASHTVTRGGGSAEQFNNVFKGNGNIRAAAFVPDATSHGASVWWTDSNQAAIGAIDGVNNGGLSFWANNGTGWTKGLEMAANGNIDVPTQFTSYNQHIQTHGIVTSGGRVSMGPLSYAYPRFNVGGPNGANEAYLSCVMSNSYYFRIRGHPSGRGQMHFNANGNITCNTSFTPASDDRLKHNEENITNGLHLIRQLVPKKYQKTESLLSEDYNGELPEDMNFMVEAGFIAQEIQKIPDLSFAVNGGDYEDTNEDGIEEIKAHPFNLCYNSVFTYVTAAVKELDAIVQAQAELIQKLESRITSMEN